MADIFDLDWEQFIDTKPATEETIRCAVCKEPLAQHLKEGKRCAVPTSDYFDPREVPTRKMLRL